MKNCSEPDHDAHPQEAKAPEVVIVPSEALDPVSVFRRRMGDRLQNLGPNWLAHLSVRCFDLDDEWAK